MCLDVGCQRVSGTLMSVRESSRSKMAFALISNGREREEMKEGQAAGWKEGKKDRSKQKEFHTAVTVDRGFARTVYPTHNTLH